MARVYDGGARAARAAGEVLHGQSQRMISVGASLLTIYCRHCPNMYSPRILRAYVNGYIDVQLLHVTVLPINNSIQLVQ